MTKAWDVTENSPRFGYFWGREYGCIFLENRKPALPKSVIAIPYLILRDNWQLAKYCNLNKFQLSIQNSACVDRESSDAYRHSASYMVAICLLGLPLFFQSTFLYETDARDSIRRLLLLYKKYQKAIFESYIFPIGNKPDNQSWLGFQVYNPDLNGRIQSGYLMIFRERLNSMRQESIAIRFHSNTRLRLHNLITDRLAHKDIGHNGEIELVIDDAPGFLFLAYTLE